MGVSLAYLLKFQCPESPFARHRDPAAKGAEEVGVSHRNTCMGSIYPTINREYDLFQPLFPIYPSSLSLLLTLETNESRDPFWWPFLTVLLCSSPNI